MDTVKILLVSATKGSKAEASAEQLKGELAKRGIDAEIVCHDLNETRDLSAYDETCDVAAYIGTGELETKLPVVGALGLLYPYLGTDSIYDGIAEIVGR